MGPKGSDFSITFIFFVDGVFRGKNPVLPFLVIVDFLVFSFARSSLFFYLFLPSFCKDLGGSEVGLKNPCFAGYLSLLNAKKTENKFGVLVRCPFRGKESATLSHFRPLCSHLVKPLLSHLGLVSKLSPKTARKGGCPSLLFWDIIGLLQGSKRPLPRNSEESLKGGSRGREGREPRKKRRKRAKNRKKLEKLSL